MNITMADILGSMVYILPHVPNDIEFSRDSGNETVETLSGNIRIVGENGLKAVSWAGIFPVNKSYSWQKLGSLADGYEYIKFLENMKKNKMPIRVVITDKNFRTLNNELMSIDTFSYKKDRAGDYTYSISLTEFPKDKWEFLNTQIANKTTYSSLVVQSVAKKLLKKFRLL